MELPSGNQTWQYTIPPHIPPFGSMVFLLECPWRYPFVGGFPRANGAVGYLEDHQTS